MTEINLDTPLIKNSFDPSIWKNADKIEHLKLNLLKIECVIEKYLNNIKEDFPQLTDHSITHSKMLWKYANIIIGNKQKYINPIEAFVLYVVFLIHDSGMCCSILNNKCEIENDPLYTDFITRYENNKNKNEEALFFTVRQRHGDFALRIATEKLKEGEYLIEDISLREDLGQIIGKIAKSHSCNANYIEREFGEKYGPPNYPLDWTIDCQKLSFILRVSDAAHIDNLRTPKTNRMISEIEECTSKEHWTFQKKIGIPQLSDDNMLVYSTNSPFTSNEQKAWWFCFDSLQVLDKELKSANEYFDVKKKEGFAAKGVKCINDTLQLGKIYIRTEGWNSINTKIKVTNPVHIASELGGVKLYGNTNVALRELVQNSIDAVNLYRTHTKQDNVNVGEIKLSIEKEHEDFFLTISDNGIGMSQTLMTNELLDFGGSYWKSDTFNFEFEGARTQGFQSIGKFGIGFFSIFMLGPQLVVTSWKFGEGIENMKTLDFYDGLFSNPILREPTKEEKLRVIDRGTSIKVKLDKNPYSKEGLIGSSQFQDNSLYSLTKFFIPSPNVRLSITELDGNTKVITPNIIDSLSFNSLIDHFHIPRIPDQPLGRANIIELLKTLRLELIEISDEYGIYGKLAIIPHINNIGISSTCLVLSNGIRINELGGFVGYIITNDVVSIKRDSFSTLINYEILREWARKQKESIETNQHINLYGLNYYGLLMTFNFYDENLPIALSKNNNTYEYVSIEEFRKFLKDNHHIKLHTEGHTLAGRLPSCDGFIFLIHQFNVSNIIREEDKEKLVQYKELISQIIKDEWGEFQVTENNMLTQGIYTLDMPYISIEEYRKISQHGN